MTEVSSFYLFVGSPPFLRTRLWPLFYVGISVFIEKRGGRFSVSEGKPYIYKKF